MAKPGKTGDPATELESAVLGVLWRDGPCTAYAIRQHFRESPAPRWSGSAGAIYPLVRRLESRGLVRSKQSARGQRRQQDYQITRRGLASFRQWLRASSGPSDATLIHDPLRTRMLFLAALPQDQARSFVSDAVDALRRDALQAKEDCRKRASDECPFSRLAARNALLLTRARLRWLMEVQEELANSATP